MIHGVGEVSQFRSRDAAGRAADVDDLVKRDVATVVCVDLLEHLPNDRHTLLRLGALYALFTSQRIWIETISDFRSILYVPDCCENLLTFQEHR